MKKRQIKANENKLENVKRVVLKTLGTHWNLTKKDNVYIYEIYQESRECKMSKGTIKQVFEAENPEDAFYEEINEILYSHSDYYIYEEILPHLRKNLPSGMYYSYETYINEIVQEYVYFTFDENAYLNQQVEVNIMIDAGDRNYDYSLNAVYPHYYGNKNEELNENAGVYWLAKTQGYTKEKLENALKNEEYNGSKFLESLRAELLNLSSTMSAITFFTSMSIGDCLEFNKHISSGQDIKLPAGIACGLYDPWNGSGSILDIIIEKDIEVKASEIDSFLPDGCRGYDVASVYGLCLSFWKPERIKKVA